MSRRIIIAAERCLGCRSCELACAVEHSVSRELLTARTEAVRPRARVTVAPGDGFCAPLQCRQCPDAPCVAVCPTHALDRADASDAVTVCEHLCVGCDWCALACPYGVIQVDRHGVVKCDECLRRAARGEEPACVVACPTGALRAAKEAG